MDFYGLLLEAVAEWLMTTSSTSYTKRVLWKVLTFFSNLMEALPGSGRCYKKATEVVSLLLLIRVLIMVVIYW